MSTAGAPAAGAAPTGPPARLVGLLEVLAVAALCAVPAVGPETWRAAADGGPVALVARAGGPAALGVVHALALAVVAVLVRATLRDLADPLRRLVALVVALAGCAAVPTGPRLLGLVLAAACLLLWRTAQRPDPGTRRPGRSAALLTVPCLVGLWAALDPGWVVGPVLGAVAVAGSWLPRRGGPAPVTGAAAARRREMVLAVAGCVAAGLLVTGLRLATSGGPVDDVVVGWLEDLWAGPVAGGTGPPALTDPLILLVLLPLVLVVGRWLRTGPPSWESVCWAGLALLLAVGPAGSSPVAGLVAAPVVAEALGSRRGSRGSPARRGTALVPLLALVLGAPLALATTTGAAAQDPVTGLRATLRALPAGTPLLADPRFGPRAQVGTGADVVRLPDAALLTALRAEPGWRAVLDGSGARAALLTDQAPLLAALQERLGWRVTARSGPLVLVRDPRAAGSG